MKIRPAQTSDQETIIPLIAQFRVTLATLKQKERKPDFEAAEEEWREYRARQYPIFVAKDENDGLIGYLVCRVDGDVVWAESLFVLPKYRRQNVGSRLYAEAERLATELGSETVYNWVHPNNDVIIRFLEKRGYNVLNLIELRRPRSGERLEQNIQVGNHTYNY